MCGVVFLVLCGSILWCCVCMYVCMYVCVRCACLHVTRLARVCPLIVFVFGQTGAGNNRAKGGHYTDSAELTDSSLGRPVPATTGRKGTLHRQCRIDSFLGRPLQATTG